ncbi:MAG: hypothetical protein HYX78_11475 [Armatimonadetes bacterium]|nr:hypothetical protein [Armatimonadota bacterium]
MALDVGRVSIEYLERPTGMVSEFARYLAGCASCPGDGNAFGFYLKEEMHEEAVEFLVKRQAKRSDLTEIKSWIEGLPWDRRGYLALTFNW